MFSRIRTTLARAKSTASTKRQPFSGLALACTLLAGCAGAGGVPPPASGDNSPPKSDPAEARVARAAPAGPVVTSTALLQRRRQAIAAMLEANITYRTLLDVKLTDAKLAGPFVRTIRSLFSTSTSEDRFYCATANLDIWPIPYPRTAVIRVKQDENGSEYLRAGIGVNQEPSECTGMGRSYGPFPELEQLRAERRRTMGKSD